MKLIKIDINNYKSIASPVSVNFQDGLPTVLIGKNGSGKSNLLEAFEHIASTNANLQGKYSAGGLRYKAHIRLEKDEFAKLFPSEAYSEEKATFTAYSSSVIKIPLKEETKTTPKVEFQPYKGKIRRSGTGGIYRIGENLWEGRYTPTNAQGKRVACNVYAHSLEECEQKLDEMIKIKKAEIEEEKAKLKEGDS